MALMLGRRRFMSQPNMARYMRELSEIPEPSGRLRQPSASLVFPLTGHHNSGCFPFTRKVHSAFPVPATK